MGIMTNSIFFPAEWHPQSAVQLTWPHEATDWCEMLDEVLPCFVQIATEVLKREKLVVVCPDAQEVRRALGSVSSERLKLVECASNDTWARDHAGISVFVDGRPTLLDFTFNGWGMKFASNLDNQITRKQFAKGVFQKQVDYRNCLGFVLEGGSIESNGAGTLLVTSDCLLSANRNDAMDEKEIDRFLKETFGLQHIHWIRHGYLSGDDTDSHVDTLVRFCDVNTLAYVLPPEDETDEHHAALVQMQQELQALRNADGAPYRLIGLPMADPVYFERERLPATYANFLIINGAVLYPTYSNPVKDALAAQQLQLAFPKHEVVGIHCLPLIKQHGSLHCVTMQYPEGFIA